MPERVNSLACTQYAHRDQFDHVLDTRTGDALACPDRHVTRVHGADHPREVRTSDRAPGPARGGPVVLELHVAGDFLGYGQRDVPRCYVPRTAVRTGEHGTRKCGRTRRRPRDRKLSGRSGSPDEADSCPDRAAGDVRVACSGDRVGWRARRSCNPQPAHALQYVYRGSARSGRAMTQRNVGACASITPSMGLDSSSITARNSPDGTSLVDSGMAGWNRLWHCGNVTRL